MPSDGPQSQKSTNALMQPPSIPLFMGPAKDPVIKLTLVLLLQQSLILI